MSEPYIGEIRLFAGNYAPAGWSFCNGQLLSISGNETLYQLIGTTYGGDGASNFNLPTLLGRIPVGQGPGSSVGTYALGQSGGEEQHTLTTNEIPSHQHPAAATSGTATTITPNASTMFGAVQRNNEKNVLGLYTAAAGTTNMPLSGNAVAFTGSGAPHENCMSTLTINYIICMEGIYPPQS